MMHKKPYRIVVAEPGRVELGPFELDEAGGGDGGYFYKPQSSAE